MSESIHAIVSSAMTELTKTTTGISGVYMWVCLHTFWNVYIYTKLNRTLLLILDNQFITYLLDSI